MFIMVVFSVLETSCPVELKIAVEKLLLGGNWMFSKWLAGFGNTLNAVITGDGIISVESTIQLL